MVYRFKIVSDEVDNFCREIEIDSEATFFQLRNIILDSVGYTKDDLSSFFLCDEDWSKQEEVTLEDMGDTPSDRDIWLMEDTPLSELLEDEGQRLIFVFDYMTERSFFMELKEIITGKTLMDPLCTRKEGRAPEQHVSLDEFDAQLEKKNAIAVEDDDILDSFSVEGIDIEDIPEGFEDMN